MSLLAGSARDGSSGVYIAHLARTDTGGDSHIVFIVRNDSPLPDLLYQTSDETWEAYNYYGNGSLYGPGSRVMIYLPGLQGSYNARSSPGDSK